MLRLFTMCCTSALDIVLAMAIFLTWRNMEKDKSSNLAVAFMEIALLSSTFLLIFS